jgi:MFS transporter, DHA1 family, inner membrane transport protein
MLLLFGIGLTAGNFLGGWLGDWRLMPSVIGILALLIPVLSLFTLTSASLVPAAVTIFCWGLLAFALISPLQMRVVNEATQAPNLASTLNQGAFQSRQRGRRLDRRSRSDQWSGLSRVAVDRRGSRCCRVHT